MKPTVKGTKGDFIKVKMKGAIVIVHENLKIKFKMIAP